MDKQNLNSILEVIKPPENIFIEESFSEAIARGKSLPDLKKLFGTLIFENSITVIFGDNGTAKTIVGMYLANCFVKESKPFGEFNNEVAKHPVFYFDLELTDRQLAKRYSDFNFSGLLTRVTIDQSLIKESENVGELLVKNCEQLACKYDQCTVFIDNISVFDSLDLENRRDAVKLLADFNRIKKINPGFTIIILAHTPKVASGPILKEHLAGSKMLTNLIDSVIGFARAESDQGVFYIKQLKQRDAAIEYHYENVICFYIENQDNHLAPIFNGFGYEKNLLETPKDKERKDRNERILSKHQGGIAVTALAKEFKLSKMQVHRIINSEK